MINEKVDPNKLQQEADSSSLSPSPEVLAHYHNPRIKKIIMSKGQDEELWRAGNGNFEHWYHNEFDGLRLYIVSDVLDYEELTKQYRTLYWTLNYFAPSVKHERRLLKDREQKTIKLGTRKTTRAYSLGIDIDGCGDIHQPDIKNAVENATRFATEKLRSLVPKSVYLLFSGGGCYVLLHHRTTMPRADLSEEDRELYWFFLQRTFDKWIQSLSQEFFIKFPQHVGKVKFDALNNAKRLFKTIFSIHKKYPYAVIPLDPEQIEIHFEDAELPLKEDIISKGERWYTTWDDDWTALRHTLDIYFQDVEEKFDTRYDSGEVEIFKTPIPEEYFPPCIKNVINGKEGQFIEGKTRAITLLITFLGQAGWGSDKAYELFAKKAETLGAQKSNIAESWFRRMCTPSCTTIQSKSGGFPRMGMGGLGICTPNELCKEIQHPFQYAKRKMGIISSDSYCYPIIEDGVVILKIISTSQGKEDWKLEFLDGDGNVINASIELSYRRNPYYLLDHKMDNILSKLKELTRLDYDKLKPHIQRFKQGIIEFVKHSKTQNAGQKKSREWETSQHEERFTVGDSEWVRWTPQIIQWIHVTPSQSGEREYSRNVILGYLEPIARVVIDGDTYWEVKLGPQCRSYFTTTDGLLKLLNREGMVIGRNRLNDTIGAILNCKAKKEVHSHACFGVYHESDTLKICNEPYPINKEHQTTHGQIESNLTFQPISEDLKAYIGYLSLFHPYEILPAMGLGAVAPLTLVLRQHGIIVPHLFNWSPESGLGKSISANAFSENLYGRKPVSGDALNSEFRFSALMDAACLPLCVDEGELLDPRKRGADLKESAERGVVDKRGTPELGMVTYLSRTTLFITGNAFPFTSQSVLVRFIAPRFDNRQKASRVQQREKAKHYLKRLKPIGFALTRWCLEKWPAINSIIDEINFIEQRIGSLFSGSWVDARRPQIWAVVYFGLMIWEKGCNRLHVQWQVPSIEDFVRDVVEPIELSAFEGSDLPAVRFQRWLKLWFIKNEGKEITIKGAEKIYRLDEVSDRSGRKVPGTWVTTHFLDEYNKDVGKEGPELKIRTLRELSNSVIELWGLIREEILEVKEKRDKPKAVKIGGHTCRVAFIPDEELDLFSPIQGNLNCEVLGGSTQCMGNKVTEQTSPPNSPSVAVNDKKVTVDDCEGNQGLPNEKGLDKFVAGVTPDRREGNHNAPPSPLHSTLAKTPSVTQLPDSLYPPELDREVGTNVANEEGVSPVRGEGKGVKPGCSKITGISSVSKTEMDRNGRIKQ